MTDEHLGTLLGEPLYGAHRGWLFYGTVEIDGELTDVWVTFRCGHLDCTMRRSPERDLGSSAECFCESELNDRGPCAQWFYENAGRLAKYAGVRWVEDEDAE